MAAWSGLQGRTTGRLYDVPTDSLSLGDRIEALRQAETGNKLASVQ